ncbi:hypothetical protein CHISP_3128 [Chitinispirillum alkaliphilum]|nr:hypothetical protein CHISP_3128 [Chitinispirillum alkaliphilum]
MVDGKSIPLVAAPSLADPSGSSTTPSMRSGIYTDHSQSITGAQFGNSCFQNL